MKNTLESRPKQNLNRHKFAFLSFFFSKKKKAV